MLLLRKPKSSATAKIFAATLREDRE